MESRRIKPYVAALAMIAALSVAAGSAQATLRRPSATPFPIQSSYDARAPIVPVGVTADTFAWTWEARRVLRALMLRLGGGLLEKTASGRDERDPAAASEPAL